MPYSNPSHRSRLTTIARISDPFSNVSTLEAAGARAEPLTADQSLVVYEFNSICEPGNSELYHLPFLFHANGDPWHEANSYVLSVIRDSPVRVSRTDGICSGQLIPDTVLSFSSVFAGANPSLN